MKNPFVSILISALVIGPGCSNTRERYLDLSTGTYVEPVKDAQTGKMVNKKTGEPLYIYVDTKTHDTIYAGTGEVINGHVSVQENKYVYDMDTKLKTEDNGEVKYKVGDDKTKMEKDGDIKIKNEDRKVKIDGETGKEKVKND